jgi:hypothetical protein
MKFDWYTNKDDFCIKLENCKLPLLKGEGLCFKKGGGVYIDPNYFNTPEINEFIF